jgi:coenzyme F420-0:L-glutamate ligase / coenzyme F420-1:gamma-L-glutamate ligase
VDFYDVTARRTSVRQFRPEPVDRAALERVLKAASQAPSTFNQQPWMFYVVTGQTRHELGQIIAQSTVHLREYLDTLGTEGRDKAVAWFSALGDAPVLIAVTMPETDDELTNTNYLLSIGAAIENLLLAVAAEGLGACAFTFSYWVKDELGRALELEGQRVVVCMIAVGHPLDEKSIGPEKRSDVAVWLD